MLGDALDEPDLGLDGLPVPISTPGWDNAPYLASAHYITKHPDSGIQNVGNYRGQIKTTRRLGMNPSVELRAGIYAHWEKCRARNQPLPCAVVAELNRSRKPGVIATVATAMATSAAPSARGRISVASVTTSAAAPARATGNTSTETRPKAATAMAQSCRA